MNKGEFKIIYLNPLRDIAMIVCGVFLVLKGHSYIGGFLIVAGIL